MKNFNSALEKNEFFIINILDKWQYELLFVFILSFLSFGLCIYA